MRTRKVEFAGSQGPALAARLELPYGRPRGYALLAHCFTCGKDQVAATRIARTLTEYGIAVLRFDFSGLGGSGGDFGNTDFSSNIDDLVLAADYLRANFEAPSLLIGHSLGGAAALAAKHRIPEVRAVATIAAPADPDHVLGLLGESASEIEPAGRGPGIPGRAEASHPTAVLRDISAQPQAERIAKLGAALLVLHSPTDEVVGIDNARRIFDTACHPKSLARTCSPPTSPSRSAPVPGRLRTTCCWPRRLRDPRWQSRPDRPHDRARGRPRRRSAPAPVGDRRQVPSAPHAEL
jgi:alpha/beta superfamily hydrolase